MWRVTIGFLKGLTVGFRNVVCICVVTDIKTVHGLRTQVFLSVRGSLDTLQGSN